MKGKKIGELSVKEFFKPTFSKIILDLALSAVLFFLFISLMPFVKDVFLKENTSKQIINISINILFFAIFFMYLYACLLISFLKKIFSK